MVAMALSLLFPAIPVSILVLCTESAAIAARVECAPGRHSAGGSGGYSRPEYDCADVPVHGHGHVRGNWRQAIDGAPRRG